VPQSLTGGPVVVENLLQQVGLLWLGIAKYGSDSVGTSGLVVLPHRTRSAV
jgi:hypothetical protein